MYFLQIILFIATTVKPPLQSPIVTLQCVYCLLSHLVLLVLQTLSLVNVTKS